MTASANNTSTPNQADPEFQAGLELIVARFCEDLPGQIASLFDLVRYGQFSTAHRLEIIRDLQGEVHKITGAAKCMGFKILGQEFAKIDRKLETAFHNRDADLAEMFDYIVEHLTGISAAAQGLRPEDSDILSALSETSDFAEMSEEAAEQQVRQALAEATVLVADDDVYTRDLIASILRSFNVRHVVAVNSGLQVLNTIRNQVPDLIITDWNMKPVTGMDLLQTVRGSGTNIPANTPMIFFTSRRDQKSQMSALTSGADRFLKKPVTPRVLRNAILNALGFQLGQLPLEEAKRVSV